MTQNRSGISIVICTHNGKNRLRPVLTAIVDQSLSPEMFELIVIDNASTDGTTAFCEQVLGEATCAFSWQVVLEKQPGLNYARLRGLTVAQFDVVLFCDDDNALSPDYLQLGIRLMNDSPVIGALGGCGIPSFESAKPSWFDTYSHSFAVGPQSKLDGRILHNPAEVYGAGAFFRKAPLLRFFEKGFNAAMSDRKGNSLTSGGDVEWCYLVQLAGYEIWYDHRLTFIHQMPEGRLQWSYYLRLKAGIASGTGRLLPYVCLLKDPQASTLTFGFNWFSEVVRSTIVYLKFRISSWIRKKRKTNELELAAVVLHQKMVSYWKHGVSGFRHFHHVKRML